MDKIHITGNAGSGKTTLARELGAALDLPVFGLDKIVWQAGWVKTPREIVECKERELISKPKWIIEGVSHGVRDAADVFIFLDVSRKTSIVRCAKRNWRFLFSSRPELPDNCPEIRIVPQLLKIIWAFKDRVRPEIMKDVSEHPGRSIIVRDGHDLQNVYERLRDAEMNPDPS